MKRNSQRSNLTRDLGKCMKASGVRAGRKAIQSGSLPNYDNYRGVFTGMGYRLIRKNTKKKKEF